MWTCLRGTNFRRTSHTSVGFTPRNTIRSSEWLEKYPFLIPKGEGKWTSFKYIRALSSEQALPSGETISLELNQKCYQVWHTWRKGNTQLQSPWAAMFHLRSTSEVHSLGSQAHQKTPNHVYMIPPSSFGTRDREDRGVMINLLFLHMRLSHLLIYTKA